MSLSRSALAVAFAFALAASHAGAVRTNKQEADISDGNNLSPAKTADDAPEAKLGDSGSSLAEAAEESSPESLEQAEGQAQVALAAGHVLRGRYVLHSFIQRLNLTNPKVAKDYPTYPDMGGSDNQLNDFAKMGHLGTGSFGDVWKAMDVVTHAIVAVKIFYYKGQYVTRNLAMQSLLLQANLNENKKECQKIIDIVKLYTVYPQGVNNICQCKAEHISDAGPSDPLFLVQEMCGKSLADILEQKEPFTKDYVRQVMTGILNGIAFLTRMSPPLIHHDLKPENVAVTDNGVAKLIDFGAMVPYSPEGQQQRTACTKYYAPPEASHCPKPPNFRISTGKPWSFDVWAAGMIYYELNCHDRNVPIPDDYKCPGGFLWFGGTGAGSSTDVEVIAGLLNPDPAKRTEPAAAVAQIAR